MNRFKVGPSSQLTNEEVGELKEVFDMLDKDHGGSLSLTEVTELLQLLGMKVGLKEARAMFAGIDADGSGSLDFQEFLKVVAAPQKLPYARAEVLQAFRRFADKGAPTGCISPEALEKALLTYGQDSGIEPLEVSRLVHSLDTTNEGFINFREQVVLLFSGRRESAAGTGMV